MSSVDTSAFGSVEAHCSGPMKKAGKLKVYFGPEPVLQHAAYPSSNLRPVLSDAYESLGFRWMAYGKSLEM
jgi:hypothetical protein